MRSNLSRKPSNKQNELEVSVVELNDGTGGWMVEAIDMPNDGNIYQAIFAGPEAEKRAREYARFKYGLQ